MKYIGIFLLIILHFNRSSSKEVDLCNFKKCGECIGSTYDCVWCSEEGVERKCRPARVVNTNSTVQWCKNDFIEYTKNTSELLRNDDFGAGVNGTVVQFRPQHIAFTGRPGQSAAFQMSYKPAKDYPLDVYYLMDNSHTMQKHKEALQNQAILMYSKLTNITNNVRLGVGSFIEKPAYPYYDKNGKTTSYAFKNHLNVTDNTTLFQSAIKNMRFGSNYDDPEAGLDALMQVMACKKELGWRERSRKFIVLCTDSTYHSAGDGKMVGIIKPHDMQCHFKDNRYAKELEQDYPSVSQINKIAKEGGFQIIFAVVDHTNEYTALAKQIVGASYALLHKEESNVVDVIIKAYTDAVSYLELDGVWPKDVELTLDPDCRKLDHKEPRNKKGCGITHNKPTVVINGVLTMKSCPGVDKQVLEIGPVGLDKDKLTVDIHYNCKCKCEKDKDGPLSSKCNNAGSRQCGLCKCVPPSYGIDCQCNGTSSDLMDNEKCKANKDDTKLCSGNGRCTCGKCVECPGFSGDYCEFNNNACPHPNKQLCSGHGKCWLGRCECEQGWTKDDCSCSSNEDLCKAPQSQNVCSGNGVCKCGVCECNKVEGKNETYSGVFCDTCDECAEKRCRELEDYVYCNYLNNKTLCDQQYNATHVLEVTLINKTEINGRDWYMGKWCKKLLEDGSYIVFKYKYIGAELIIAIQSEPELPPEANIWIAVGSAIGTVLLIGLLTVVIWKILIDMHDAKEYEKFSKQSAAAGFDVSKNPLYEAPATNFANPAYTGRM